MAPIVFSLILFGVFMGFGFCSSLNQSATINYRLNTDIEPIEYIIDLTPYFDDKVLGKAPFTFDGICTITIKANQMNLDTIVVHKQDLNITDVSLTKKPGFFSPFPWKIEHINVKSTTYDNVTHKFTVMLATPLNKDESYDLNFKYTGNLRNDMTGFYRSSYKEGNFTKWIAATQMEPMSARKVFPCFDEPQFKALFSIIVNRAPHFKPTISNTAMASSYFTSSNSVREYFEKTPKMSTYLVAIIISEFECQANPSKKFFICSRPTAIAQSEFSFNIGQQLMAEFDEIFDYNYSTHMTKMTLAAIPDFKFGAMENWGLLTYREKFLVFDPKQSTAIDQQEVAKAVAHEASHMWFGNLVTCDWWNNVWLQEGFAEFFEYLGAAMIDRSWGLEHQFVVSRLQPYLVKDSLESSISLAHDVNTPEDIYNLPGELTVVYAKGAAVIRMMQHVLGDDKFINGLRKYLKTNALKSVTPKALYAAFQSEVGSDFNVTETMGSWISQPGYPILNVNIANDRKRITVTQKRFLQSNPNHHDKTLWHVPVTYASGKENSDFTDTKPITLLTNQSLEINLKEPVDWIILNVQQTGYYRVNYDDKTWTAIANVLHKSHDSIHVLNRAQIIDDALRIASASYLNYEKALHIVQYLQNETDYIPWKAAFDNFEFILNRFKPTEARTFAEFQLKLLNRVYEHLGFYGKANDTSLDILNRNNVLKYACQLGHKQCIAASRAEFDHFVMGNHTIPIDLTPIVYCSVIEHGTDKEWNILWNKFQSSNFDSEQSMILKALGCTKQPNLLQKYFNLILSDEIRLHNKKEAFQSIVTQQQNIPLVIDFLTAKHKEIDAAFEDDQETEFPELLTELMSKITTDDELNRIRKIIAEKRLESKMSVKSSLETAQLNVQWSNRNIPAIKSFLKAKKSAATHQATISCLVLVSSIFIAFYQ